MKHWILLFSLCGMLVGCAHVSERTLAQGINYGMTQEQVLANLERTQKVIFCDHSKIVTEGYDSTWGMKRRNTFIFQDGKLAMHENNPAGN